MSSGYGLSGGPSRCFPFWQEVLACYVTTATPDDPKAAGKCGRQLEDYYECLHHKKEAAKIRALQAAYRKHEHDNPQDNAPTAQQVKRLGLLDSKSPEEVDIRPAKFIPYIKDRGNAS